ncbi:molybdenum cofactor biosynthesis protein E [Galdieria sulphuraria]|uniref:Molybdenum cofactor biosynthesis protein E n=1 Tax=Galdieria sulphuraria TaxID=130081 RepID=M2Y6I9_GALSU|nr:molybdenum cofactor biosynthesis protein E [Galdieria sulphuraria]EME31464.1 molybdenum cofactor biosynthesis protein E [Galdieria sulphuraria]|eukprot:XP_005707984.1 molybdenum cofactor biosynthesis protein E [Galdieria sulphuraria]
MEHSFISEDGRQVFVLTSDTLSVEKVTESVSASESGAIASFCGITRKYNHGKEVKFLEYESYFAMALSELRKLAEEIRSHWKVEGISIWHRLGRVGVGEISVVIAVSSVHRKEALEACHFAIDQLKAR